MASLTESSVASVPLSKIMQLHEEMLKEQSVDHTQRQPEPQVDTPPSGVDSASATKGVASTIPESVNAYHTPISSPRPPPRLSTSRSAPPTEMEAMLHPSPSQEAFVTLTRANSFPGGDTQPMESQVYRDFTASIVQPTTITPKKAILQVQTSPDGDLTYNTILPENSPKTYVEGDTGYVDLANAYMPTSPTALSTSSHVDELLDNPHTQHGAEHVLRRPAMPETPAVAGHKRNNDGEVVASSSTHKKTPGFTQLFGGHDKVQMLSATQLFDQTQDPSSPPAEGPRSDPIITRPSPILHNHMSLSSPTLTMTSPVQTTYCRPGTAGEPRGNYTSVLESQEREAGYGVGIGLRRQPGHDIIDEADDEDDDREVERYAQMRRRREMDEHAKKEWSKVRFSSRPNSRPTSRQNSSQQGPVNIDLVTPAPDKGRTADVDLLDDEIYISDEAGAMEDDEANDDIISNDEYDELAQEVVRSQPNNEEDEEQEGTNVAGINDEDVEMHESSHLSEEHHENGGAIRELQTDQTATQPSAIADSQPSRTNNRRSLLSQQPKGASSIPSMIPGSQIASKFQSQAGDAMHTTTSSNELVGPTASDGPVDDVPSSPPAGLPRLNTESSRASELQQLNTRTIPESDLPGSEDEAVNHSSPPDSNNGVPQDSNALLYLTARTHASASGASWRTNTQIASPFKVFASQQSKVYSQSPRTAAGVRHFADITGAASTPQGSAEMDVDVDAIVSDVVTADDQDFMEMISTPSKERQSKRRKTTHESSDAPSKADVSKESKGKQLQQTNDEAKQTTMHQKNTLEKSVMFEQPLQESPSKANEARATPGMIDAPDSSTPESVKERERAGAAAVSQVLANRKSNPTKTPKTYGKGNKRSAAIRQASLKSANASESEVTESPSRRTILEQTSTAVEAEEDVTSVDETEPAVDAVDEQTSEDREAANARATGHGHNITDASLHTPNRVFALFKGQPYNYYPATCLGTSPDGSSYRVKFDDDTDASVETHHVCRLELLVGDVIKVDIQGMRGKTWQVIGFGPAANNREQRSGGTDIYGRSIVKISPKSNRKSDANDTAPENGENITEVAMGTLYITPAMWASFENRLFLPAPTLGNSTSRAATPSSGGLPTDVSASRSGRTLVPTAKAGGTRSSNLRDESISRPESPAAHGILAGMAFAISYGSADAEKADVTRLIQRNGGIILEKGFDEMFNVPNLDETAPTSPAKKSPRKTTKSDADSTALQLKPEYTGLGFVALLADRHSRRAKYVQALALGLPTLSGKWIVDSLDPSKNKSNTALSWSKYLLPAGESSYLGGAIRSRTLSPYNASGAQLSTTIAEREILLYGDGVLIVAAKKGKSTWERRKPYAFLTLALGAAYVKRVSDLAEAKAFATNEPEKWKWIYVDGSVADASLTVFGKGSTAGKKRKRGDEAVKVDAKAMWATNGKLKIVNDEFVVQSLILGALVD